MGIWDVLLTVALGAAVGYAAGAAASYVVDYYISKQKLREEVGSEFKTNNPFLMKVREAKSNAVKVGIFSNNGTEIAERTYQSSKGISSDIQVGQVIML